MEEKKFITQSDMLQHSKQELIQADAKLGWMAAIFILIISSLLTLAIFLNSWISWTIIGSVSILPLSSLMFIFIGLIPRNIKTKKGDLNPFNYEKFQPKFQFNELVYDDLIQINLMLARKKYKACIFSFWYINPIIVVLRKYFK